MADETAEQRFKEYRLSIDAVQELYNAESTLERWIAAFRGRIVARADSKAEVMKMAKASGADLAETYLEYTGPHQSPFTKR